MTWIECNKHKSIFYDSSVHKKCPVCLNGFLKTALFKWATVDIYNLLYEKFLLKWSGLSLHAMNRTISEEERIRTDADAESTYMKITELQKTITAEYKELKEYLAEQDICSILSATETGVLRKRTVELYSK